MKNTLINLFAKIFGIDPDKINGWKTYAGGAIELLSGIAGILAALANVIQELLKLSTLAEYVSWFQAAYSGNDLAVIALGAAAAVAGKGLADIGLAHKHDKLLDSVNTQTSKEVKGDS